jgi:hypothetical protein
VFPDAYGDGFIVIKPMNVLIMEIASVTSNN